jgi:cbb3-type cytochrome oxidase maturation protein
MSVIIILISASLLVATGFLISFFWAVKSGQYDDDYTPSVRMLFDNEPLKEEHTTTNKKNTVSNIKLQNDL